MAIDLSRFADSFYQEAGDHLVTMESLLLAIGSARQPDAESLNAIFRAAHSIKGGAGAFGHAALGNFTHALESAFERLRNGDLDLTKVLTGVFLRCVDATRAHVDALRQGKPADASAFQCLENELAECLGQASRIHAALSEPFCKPGHHVELALDAAEFPDRPTVDALLAELAALGDLAEVSIEFERGRNGVLGFVVETDAAIEETRDSLRLFVADAAIRKCLLRDAAGVEANYLIVAEAAPPDAPFGFFPAGTQAQPATFAEADSVRMNVAKMDELVNLVGELVITQAIVSRSAQAAEHAPALAQAVAQLERNTRDLQRSILSIRMLPIRHVTSRIPRLVRDVSERLGKEVVLALEGEETELDKGLIERLADPLMHLVRNAIDHGIEDPQARAAQGKDSAGTVTVRARHEGGKVVISVSDDGAGLDRTAIVAQARRAGIEVGEQASDEEVWQLIFRPGLSTAATITEVSGRGVGMDVVQRNVHALGGAIAIDSVAGRGTTFTLRLPLTLAIIEGMSIVADGEAYIIPLAAIAQSLRSDACDPHTMGGRDVLRFDGQFIPLVPLGELFGHASGESVGGGVLVVLDADGQRAAVRVDALLGLHQTVVKGLEDHYRRIDGVAGATILGDGRVALILDAQRVIEKAASPDRREA